VMHSSVQTAKIEMDVSSFQNGIYFIRFNNDENVVFGKFLKIN
jgi:hypothetical protein